MPVINIPAPVGGINARDSYATMPITDAVSLVDFIPSTNYCETAPPCSEYINSPPGGCQTLVGYESGSTAKLLGVFEVGAGSWDIVDITNPVSPSNLKTAQGAGIYVSTMFQSKLILCNGVNTPQVYNGTSCTDLVATGPTLGKLRGAITFKGRVYYWEEASLNFHYAAAGAYQGTLTAFPVDTIARLGGRIVLLTAFTRDGGDGADDLFIIVMDTGEILVYQGDDPSTVSAWELVGQFIMPRPLGVRSVGRLGGNTLLSTYEGVVNLGSVLASRPYPLVSDKVRKLMAFQPDVETAVKDLVTILDFPEAASLLFIDMAASGATRWTPYYGTMCMTKAAGSWWSYGGSSTADFDFQYLSCGCVWQGRTYFGFYSGGTLPIFTPLDESASYFTETISQPWYPVGKHGYAFSADYAGNVTTNYSPDGTSAYVTPFGGLLGNATMSQPVVGEIPNFWTGARTKQRWISTNLRIKSGGTR